MPWPGFEPGRLTAPPPQDGVSTSFTTRAEQTAGANSGANGVRPPADHHVSLPLTIANHRPLKAGGMSWHRAPSWLIVALGGGLRVVAVRRSSDCDVMDAEWRGPKGGQPYPERTVWIRCCRRTGRVRSFSLHPRCEGSCQPTAKRTTATPTSSRTVLMPSLGDGTVAARWTAISQPRRELQVDSGLPIRCRRDASPRATTRLQSLGVTTASWPWCGP